ncbi:MAG: M15 family metallopeptidase [Peptostreptococcaceae bacterium]
MKKISKSIILILIGLTSLVGCSDKSIEDGEYINIKVQEENIKNEEDINLIFEHSEISNRIKEQMIGKSMPEGANISFNELSYVQLTHYGFDGKVHSGEMIVDKRLAPEVVEIFKELYDKKYPIEKFKLIDEYDANDNLSMNDNNSSAFCYRTIKGTNKISNHGKGMAIDINPFQNPHVIGETTNPVEAFAYSDRTINELGLIREGDDCYNAFVSRGWTWGGHWNNPDYQHFEKSITE